MLRGGLFILLGIVSFGTFYVAMAPSITPVIEPEEELALAEAGVQGPPAEVQAEAVPEEAEPAPVRPVRDVTTAEITAVPEAPSAEARIERIFNAVVESAGVIMSGDRAIQLAGIEAPGAEQTCGASEWPCGRMARAALRRLVRGRAVECEVPAGEEDVPDAAICSVAGENLSEWLVAQGWAESTGEAYAGIEIGAREDELGIWAAARPGVQEDLAESDPESDLAINVRVSATP